MGIIVIMVIASIAMALVFLGAFIWATKSGQFDDDYTPSIRILFDDNKKIKTTKDKK